MNEANIRCSINGKPVSFREFQKYRFAKVVIKEGVKMREFLRNPEQFNIKSNESAKEMLENVVSRLSKGESLMIKNDPESDVIYIDGYKWKRST